MAAIKRGAGAPPSNDELITLSAAARLLPSHPHASSLWRWCRRGIRVRGTGEVIRLEHRRYGSKVFTSAAALEQFGTALAAADAEHFAAGSADTPKPTTRNRTDKQRRKDIDAAGRRCEALGV